MIKDLGTDNPWAERWFKINGFDVWQKMRVKILE